MTRILVIPRAGMTVRDPKTMQPLPAEGAVKLDDSYWRRRQRDGDVTIKPEPKASSKSRADKSDAGKSSK